MKKFLSVVLALVMTMSLVTITAGAKDFTDKSKITYGEAVDVISAVGVIDGYTDGSFNPSATLTRGAAAKIICNLILGPTTGASLGADAAPFKDVPVSNVFAGYIAYCSQQGIINGYSDGTFKPAGTVTGYQFMKMLLGALGYDGKVEGFTGANWSVAVAKLAVSIGLDDGNDSFVGSAAMTREQACLYAYNTMKATMVEYDSTGTTISVGGTTITSGASKASDVKNTSTKTIKDDSLMQFAEKYFKDLKLTSTSNTDAFARPANTWKYKTTDVGTYAKTADASYTAKVKLGTIYSDLGLGSAIASGDITVYEDGVLTTAYATKLANGITKGDTTNKLGGAGTLTEVYYDSDTSKVTIVLVNTYVADVTATKAATASKDAYITVAPRGAGLGGNYETTDSYAVDDIVLYTYSYKSGDSGVKSVAKAETVTGTLTGYTAGDSATVAGTTYTYAAKVANEAQNGSVKYDVTVVLDKYGNAIDIDASKTSTDYAVVLKYKGADSWDNAKAKLLYTDGTTGEVTLTTGNTATVNDIVSYKTNNKSEYTLTSLGSVGSFANASLTDTKNAVTKGNSTIALDGATVANGKTIFLVATKNGSDTVYTAYTGISSVPSIIVAKDSSIPVTAYCKTGTTATVVFLDATSNTSVTSSTKDVVFVKGSDTTGSSYDTVMGTYYVYDAIINGEITKINSANKIADNTMFSSVSYDANKVATLSGSDGITAGTGVVKAANGVIGLNGAYYSYDDACKVFYIDSDGNISTSSVTALATDESNNVWFKITDGDVTTIVVKQVETATNGFSIQAVNAAGDPEGSAVAVASATGATTKTVATAATLSVATDKTLALKVTARDLASTVTVSPATVTLESGTISYTFTVVATSETGVTQTCTVTVTATSVGA